MIVDNFCGFLSLKNGVLCIATFYLMIYFTYITMAVIAGPSEIGPLYWVLLWICVGYCVVNLMLIVGVCNDKPLYVLIWFWVHVFSFQLTIVSLLHQDIETIMYGASGPILVTPSLIGLSMLGYFLIVVRSYYCKIVERVEFELLRWSMTEEGGAESLQYHPLVSTPRPVLQPPPPSENVQLIGYTVE